MDKASVDARESQWSPPLPDSWPPPLTRSELALVDSITPLLYCITSPFTNLKQLRARLGLRPCQSRRKPAAGSRKSREGQRRDGLNSWKRAAEDGGRVGQEEGKDTGK